MYIIILNKLSQPELKFLTLIPSFNSTTLEVK